MLNYRVQAVIKKELREKLLSKSFILMTLLIPLFMFGIIGLQTFFMSFEDDEVNLIVVTEETELLNKLQTEFAELEYVKNKKYKVRYETLQGKEIGSYVQTQKENLLNDKLNGIIYVPVKSTDDKKLEYYSKTPSASTLLNRVKIPINKVLLDNYFEGKNFTGKDISFAKEDVQFSEYKVTADKDIQEAGYGNTIVAFLFTFLLYMSLIMIGSMMMTSVIEEKNSRVVEILLSSLSSKDLLTGKILGTAITSLFQMLVWLSPLIIIISTTWFVLPAEFIIHLDGFQITYFMVNYFIALITFLGLFASTGSLFENSQDAQQGMWPIMLLIMIPFFIALAMMENAENSLARIASMFPFASLIVMPARMSLVEIPLWQLLVSLIVNLTTMVLIFPLAGKIYRVGILKTGKKPGIKEIIGWLKYSN
jgi:ABC-2 type transport system permease protein